MQSDERSVLNKGASQHLVGVVLYSWVGLVGKLVGKARGG